MTTKLGASRLPADVRTEVEAEVRKLSEALADALDSYSRFVTDLAERHVVTSQQALARDPVRERLDELFDGRVGDAPQDDEREKRVAEALRRIDARVPPGFKDAGKEDDDRKAGDYMVWRELLDYAKTLPEGSKVLFVTADVKEDWFARSGGKPTGPLPALVKEFLLECPGQQYHQVALADFLGQANAHLSAAVATSTIEKASDVGRSISPAWDAGVGTEPSVNWLDFSWPSDQAADYSAKVRRLLKDRPVAGTPEFRTINDHLHQTTSAELSHILRPPDRMQEERRLSWDLWRKLNPSRPDLPDAATLRAYFALADEMRARAADSTAPEPGDGDDVESDQSDE